jgi:hypothetical protein
VNATDDAPVSRLEFPFDHKPTAYAADDRSGKSTATATRVH